MGCDIHPFFEVKINGKWMFYGPGNISRNYRLFSRLADVRNPEPGEEGYIEPISQPRGIPSDASEMYKIESEVYGEDGHSHSWISSEEYVKICEEFKEEAPRYRVNNMSHPNIYLFGNEFCAFCKYPEDYPGFVEDFRMLFFFDN